jgi:hypothetical protein
MATEIDLEVVGIYYISHQLTGESVVQVNFGSMIKVDNQLRAKLLESKVIPSNQIGDILPKIDMVLMLKPKEPIPYTLNSKWRLKINAEGKMELSKCD